MQSHFEYVVNTSSPIPPPELNGGWFTGEPFDPNGGYKNIYVKPCIAYWNNKNLKSADPPNQALYQLQGGYRPGNNTDQQIPELENISSLNVFCTPIVCQGGLKQKNNLCGNKRIIIST